jgi:3-hydroxyacyl-[acyl-carrier-protein] dehydratase
MIGPLESDAIQALLPHRYPMLLVDRILELEPGKRAVGLKNVTANEPYFQGHFPGMAVMPGVLIIEAMAQVAGIMMLACTEYRGRVPFIAAIESARYYRPVVPGDSLIIEATVAWIRSQVGKVDFVARVAGEIVVKGEMKFALKSPPATASEQLMRLDLATASAGPGKQGE